MTGKRRKLVTCCLAGVVLLVSGLFWLCCLSESAFLKEAPYDVELPELPQLDARLYSLDAQRYLLVVYAPGTSIRRGFTVDILAKKMGMPDFTSYTRFGKFALVDKMTLLGYCETCAGLAAEFEASGDSWAIKVTGYADDPTFRDSFLEKQLLVYEQRVVLSPRRRDTSGRQRVESAI